MKKETEIDFRVLGFLAFHLLQQAQSGFERSGHLAEALRKAKQEDVAKNLESARKSLDDAAIELDRAYKTLKRRERKNR